MPTSLALSVSGASLPLVESLTISKEAHARTPKVSIARAYTKHCVSEIRTEWSPTTYWSGMEKAGRRWMLGMGTVSSVMPATDNSQRMRIWISIWRALCIYSRFTIARISRDVGCSSRLWRQCSIIWRARAVGTSSLQGCRTMWGTSYLRNRGLSASCELVQRLFE